MVHRQQEQLHQEQRCGQWGTVRMEEERSPALQFEALEAAQGR